MFIHSFIQKTFHHVQDFHAVDWRLFKDSGTNITGISLVDIESNRYADVVGREWSSAGVEKFGPPNVAFNFGDDSYSPVAAFESNMEAYWEQAHILPRTLMVIKKVEEQIKTNKKRTVLF